MSEQNTPQEGQQESNDVQLSPTQQEALNQGWVPKEEYHGDPEKWVDAGEFLRRGELFKKIESQGRELKEVRRALDGLKTLHASVREVEYQRALETLKAQKKEALESGDADAVIAADERIDLVKEQQRMLAMEQTTATQPSGEQHPIFVEWKNRNSWYESSRPMKAFADARGAELAAEGISPPEVLKIIEKEIRQEFPQKFQNQRQNRAPAVETGNNKGGSSKAAFQLTPEERRIMQTFVRQGVMTEEKYIADLKKIKGV